MKKTEAKSRKLERRVRNLHAEMESISGEVDDISDAMSESRELLYDIKEILEDKLITGVPTSPAEVLEIWNERYPGDGERRALEAIIASWSDEPELRTLVSQVPTRVRERFIGLVREDAAPSDIQYSLGDIPRMTNEEEGAFEAIKSAWVKATALRTLLSVVPKSGRERFIGLLRVDASTSSSVAD